MESQLCEIAAVSCERRLNQIIMVAAVNDSHRTYGHVQECQAEHIYGHVQDTSPLRSIRCSHQRPDGACLPLKVVSLFGSFLLLLH